MEEGTMSPATPLMAAFGGWRQQNEQLGCWSIKALPLAFPSPFQPGPTVTAMAEAGMCSAWCQAGWRGQPFEPCLWPEHPRMCCRMDPHPRKIWGEGWEVGGEEPKGQELELFSRPCKRQGDAQGKLPPAPASATTCMCPWSIIPTAFVIFCKSFGQQQGIPTTSDSLTPLGYHSTEPLVPTATA